MKWLVALLLALFVFGGAWVGYNIVFHQEIQVRKEERGEIPAAPTPDITLPEFEAAAKLRQEGKLVEARDALSAFILKYPSGLHVEEAKDMLGDINVSILLSAIPSPEKEEYIVKPGDVLAKISRKLKTTPELIMRMNNLSGTMLHIGDRLLISHPDLSLVIQRKAKLVVLLNHGAFFKQYHVLEEKLPARQSSKVTTKVSEIMAWRDGKRVGWGSKEFIGSTRWIRLGSPTYMIYALPDGAHQTLGQPPPAQGLGLAATDTEELSGLVNSNTPVTITD